MIAVIASVIQNAFQTPTAPKMLLSKNAVGMITTTYRQSEISNEGMPFPSPSSAPEDVTETAETIKPAPMIRRAVFPIWIVASVWVNSPISWPGISSFSYQCVDRTGHRARFKYSRNDYRPCV